MWDVVGEMAWFDNIIRNSVNAGIIQSQPPLPILDAHNQSTIDFTKPPIENKCSRHIDIKLLFILEQLFEGKFKLK